MAYIYSSIGLPASLNEYTVNGKTGLIEGLSNINIFIGENNAGKSRFMRELAKTDQSSFQIDGMDFGELRSAFDEFMKSFESVWVRYAHDVATATLSGYGHHEPSKISLESYIPSTITPDFFDSTQKNPLSLARLLMAIHDGKVTVQSQRGNPQQAIAAIRAELDKEYAQDFIELLNEFYLERVEFDKCYIPTIRSLNDFDIYQRDPSVDIFESRIRTIYDFGGEAALDVFTGQKIYERIKEMLLGDVDLRRKMAEYESFLSEKLFDGKEVVIIPKIDQDVVNVRIGNEEKPIYELGDGIQSLIILTFPLFESKHGLFFIEEPELNMHPGMQRKFLEAIQANPQHQYYFTTHSNHLLDLTIDYTNISIYTFTKLEEGRAVELVTHGDKNVLELIGARSTSVFLANKSVWVEGITDRLYLKKYLDLYLENNPTLEKPREDIDYIFIEYGGNNITHWSFLDSSDPTINTERITSNLMLIADSDGNAKQDRKSQLRAKLGARYVVLREREIENTLSIGTVLNVVSSYEKAELGDLKIDTSGITTTPMGEFIESKIFTDNGIKQKRKGGYKADSGTVKSKLDFCHRAIEELTYEDMTPSSIALAKKIHKFATE